MIDEGVSVSIRSAALYERFVHAAMRHEFGGHVEKKL
jgi:6-phosphogluconate dehydrogenase (decarboxylating)